MFTSFGVSEHIQFILETLWYFVSLVSVFYLWWSVDICYLTELGTFFRCGRSLELRPMIHRDQILLIQSWQKRSSCSLCRTRRWVLDLGELVLVSWILFFWRIVCWQMGLRPLTKVASGPNVEKSFKLSYAYHSYVGFDFLRKVANPCSGMSCMRGDW